ncbi:MAG: hypothetical protein K8R58_06975 [Bacteroidales bacterium]|nr:hypothetical protein [Bacteroidales bacterium]
MEIKFWIWDERLKWFRLQANEELLGEIDEKKTGNGTIVCKDGFSTYTVSPDEFLSLTADFKTKINITEVDKLSIFFEINY